MSMREWTHEGERDATASPEATAVPAPAAAAVELARRLLARGAEAIDRVLSNDSAAFLRANRQQGGE